MHIFVVAMITDLRFILVWWEKARYRGATIAQKESQLHDGWELLNLRLVQFRNFQINGFAKC
jgi:hypothetical protein